MDSEHDSYMVMDCQGNTHRRQKEQQQYTPHPHAQPESLERRTGARYPELIIVPLDEHSRR